MTNILKPDICVIGAGSGGLSVAAGASQMGASVVLVERHRLGGECLYTGCVPSKALLAAAHAAATARSAARLGIRAEPVTVDFSAVYDHLAGVIDEIEPQDSIARYEGLGVHVIQASARFTSPRELIAGDQVICPRRAVIATGARPAVPPIPGLDTVSYLTNQTLFSARIEPGHLIVIGAGPIGVELGQAYRRLGAAVTLLDSGHLLSAGEGELVRILAERLSAEGVTVRQNVTIESVAPDAEGVAVKFRDVGKAQHITGTHLLVATGRKRELDDLGLEAAGIAIRDGILVLDRRLRTTNRRVFAVGDIAGPHLFTHMASYQAGIVLRNALFRLPALVADEAVPWVIYTDPEYAHVGLSLEAARRIHGDVRLLRWPFDKNDRALAERQPDGMVQAVVTRKGRVLGASILGPHAGEQISLWTLAIARGLKVSALAGLVVPYPTYSEASKRAAATFYTPSLFGVRTRALVRFLARFG